MSFIINDMGYPWVKLMTNLSYSYEIILFCTDMFSLCSLCAFVKILKISTQPEVLLEMFCCYNRLLAVSPL